MRLAHLDKAAKRVYLRDSIRIHHGLAGCLLMVAGFATARRAPFIVGAILALHDIQDIPWSVHDAY